MAFVDMAAAKPAEHTVSRSIFDSAARDAAAAVLEILDMDYNDDMIVQFLSTTDGKRLVSALSRMLSFFNERKIAELEGRVI